MSALNTQNSNEATLLDIESPLFARADSQTPASGRSSLDPFDCLEEQSTIFFNQSMLQPSQFSQLESESFQRRISELDKSLHVERSKTQNAVEAAQRERQRADQAIRKMKQNLIIELDEKHEEQIEALNKAHKEELEKKEKTLQATFDQQNNDLKKEIEVLKEQLQSSQTENTLLRVRISEESKQREKQEEQLRLVNESNERVTSLERSLEERETNLMKAIEDNVQLRKQLAESNESFKDTIKTPIDTKEVSIQRYSYFVSTNLQRSRGQRGITTSRTDG